MKNWYVITGILVVLLAIGLVSCVPVPVGFNETQYQPGEGGTPPATENKPEGKLIRDLAYIEGIVYGYSDDADPEDEGIQIGFLWYDTKSKWIIFRNIPISVDIELYPRGFDWETGKYTLERCIYKGEAQIDSSLSHIRIPFEDINATPTGDYTPGCLAKVTIHTPQQGDYSIECVGIVSFESEATP